MNYDSFLNNFLSGISQCLDWLKNLFIDSVGISSGSSEGSALFTHPLIFTIMGISLFTLIIEELVGVLTSFRFGGFFFRRFGRGYGSGYRTKYETEYPKSYEVDYSVETAKPFKSRFGTKYFINYNGKLYPLYHSRFNPFYFREFNVAYKSGRIVSYNQIYGSKLSGGLSSFGHSNSGSGVGGYSSSINTAYSANRGASALVQAVYAGVKGQFAEDKPLGEGIPSNPDTVSSGAGNDGSIEVSGLYTGPNGFDNFNGTEETYTTSESSTTSHAGRNFNTGEEQLDSTDYDMDDYGGITYEDSE